MRPPAQMPPGPIPGPLPGQMGRPGQPGQSGTFGPAGQPNQAGQPGRKAGPSLDDRRGPPTRQPISQPTSTGTAAARPTARPTAKVPAPPPRRDQVSIANRIAFIAVLGFFAFLVLYITYEFGRYNGSYDRLAVSQQLSERDVQIERLEAGNRQLRTKLAELDTINMGRPKEQSALARTIGELQAQVARESQELAFYRGLMAKAPTELGVRLGEVHIERSSRPGVYIVHVALLRTGRTDDPVKGTLTLHVDSDKGKVMDLSDLTGGRLKELPFDFRYYKYIPQEVVIPGDFKPLHLGVDLRSVEKDAPPLAQTYGWADIGGAEPGAAAPPVSHR